MFNVTMEPMDSEVGAVSVRHVGPGLIGVAVKGELGDRACVYISTREARMVAKVMQLLAAQVERQEGE